MKTYIGLLLYGSSFFKVTQLVATNKPFDLETVLAKLPEHIQFQKAIAHSRGQPISPSTPFHQNRLPDHRAEFQYEHEDGRSRPRDSKPYNLNYRDTSVSPCTSQTQYKPRRRASPYESQYQPRRGASPYESQYQSRRGASPYESQYPPRRETSRYQNPYSNKRDMSSPNTSTYKFQKKHTFTITRRLQSN